MLTLAFLFAAAQATPQQGPIRTFGDWVVACDNVKRCEMTSLFSEMGDMDAPQMSITRAPGPGGGWTVELTPPVDAKGLRLSVEGGAATVWTGERFTGADAAAIVAGLANGTAAVVTDPAGKASGAISLAGTSAALRFIDAEQGRAGTVTAMVARGAKPAGTVPAARALPRIAYRLPAGAAQPYSAATYAGMWAQSGCSDSYDADSRPEPRSHALGGGKTLVLIPCGSGAYNFSTVPYVLADGKATVARFDMVPGWTDGEGIATLVNAGFDPRTGRLGSYAKGRGLGDCGSSETYVWDGEMFRLVEARAMGECRGSVNWLAVWRAQAVPQ